MVAPDLVTPINAGGEREIAQMVGYVNLDYINLEIEEGNMTKQNIVVKDGSSFAKSSLNIATISVAVANSPLVGGARSLQSNASLAPRSKKKPVFSIKKLETGDLINARVESMRASSPTHLRSLAVQNDKQALSNPNWLNHRLPSALNNFEYMMESSKGKQIVMFLDYDGTLSPIVDDPDQAFMSDAMRAAVRDVARYFPTAIVSGRCRDKVYGFVKLAELYYAGSHGMDIKGPAKRPRGIRPVGKADQSVLFQPATEFLPMIDEVYKKLVEKTSGIPGSNVEHNRFCVSVHYRCVEEKRWIALSEEVRGVLKGYSNLRLTEGRKVLEIRPTIKWDKGKALEFLLESLGYANCSDVLPVYIGDDRTDEDAFKVLRERGQGFGILVSKIPKETNATYSLKEPSEVMDFLRRLVQWKRLSRARDSSV